MKSRQFVALQKTVNLRTILFGISPYHLIKYIQFLNLTPPYISQ